MRSASTSLSARRMLCGICVAIAVLASAGCAIQEEGGPRIIPDEERGPLGAQPTGGAAAGSNRIFLLTPETGDEQPRLRSVLRDVASNPTAILSSLLAGENPIEQEGGLSSVLPDDLKLLSARLLGRRLTIDVNEAINELTSEALPFAVAQLVATATEIEGVENVRLQINGENQAWPLGNRENTDRLLTAYDYPGFVESSQSDYPSFANVNN
jgi:Sporulation and spore germination